MVSARYGKGPSRALHRLLALQRLFYPVFCYVHQILPFSSNCAGDNFRSKSRLLMTIITAQRQTFRNVVIYLLPCGFSRSQLYVASFRTSSFDNVAVAINGWHRQRTENNRLITSNIVYREVL